MARVCTTSSGCVIAPGPAGSVTKITTPDGKVMEAGDAFVWLMAHAREKSEYQVWLDVRRTERRSR